MEKAIFCDRDGVINKRPTGKAGELDAYIIKWEDFEFLPGVFEALAMLYDAGYELICVSNQSCVGRGMVDPVIINDIFESMADAVRDEVGANLYWYYCPHAPDAGCCCRKPKPGLIYHAAVLHDIHLSQSWMVGDSWSDIIAADKGGIRHCVKIGDFYQIEETESINITCDVLIQRSLLDAAKYIVEGT